VNIKTASIVIAMNIYFDLFLDAIRIILMSLGGRYSRRKFRGVKVTLCDRALKDSSTCINSTLTGAAFS
jgi:hypothetical protein